MDDGTRPRHGGCSPPWTEEQYGYLRAHYGELPAVRIAEHVGKSLGAVYVQASLLGLKSRHRTGINSLVPGYFKVIDTPLKAYLLGLWASDGYVTGRNQVCIALADKDRVLVELARDASSPTGCTGGPWSRAARRSLPSSRTWPRRTRVCGSAARMRTSGTTSRGRWSRPGSQSGHWMLGCTARCPDWPGSGYTL